MISRIKNVSIVLACNLHPNLITRYHGDIQNNNN